MRSMSERRRDNSVHDRLYNQMHKQNENKKALEAKVVKQSMQECTFSPYLIS